MSVSSKCSRAAIVSAYALGRGVSKLRPVAVSSAKTPPTLGPVKAGVAMGAMWGTVYAWMNVKRHQRGEITKNEVIRDTACESVGLGVATVAGLIAANAARVATVAVYSGALVPFMVGSAVMGGAKYVWDQKMKRPAARSIHGMNSPVIAQNASLRDSSCEE